MKAGAKALEQSSGPQLFLRIKHPSLDPASISEALGIEPEQAIAAGSALSSAGVRRLHSESYWIAKLPTPSIRQLAERLRERLGEGLLSDALPPLSKDDLLATMGATEQDVRISMRLKRFEPHKEFFERINAEGGSITLIVDRGESLDPVVLKHSLKKLAELGIALEVD
jgi:hypothetical protein